MPNNGSAIDFHYVLLDHYKALGIKEDELAVILLIDHLLKQGNDLVTADLLSLKMNLKTKELDSLMVDLVKKGILEYDTSGKTMRTSLKPLEARLVQEFEKDIARDKQRLLRSIRFFGGKSVVGFYYLLDLAQSDLVHLGQRDRVPEQYLVGQFVFVQVGAAQSVYLFFKRF